MPNKPSAGAVELGMQTQRTNPAFEPSSQQGWLKGTSTIRLPGQLSVVQSHISCAQACSVSVGGHSQGLQAGTAPCLLEEFKFGWDSEQPGLVSLLMAGQLGLDVF